jgi:hypothetical protein
MTIPVPQSDKADKRRPMIERVAALMGGTAFRDSAGRSGMPKFTDQDVAAALGMVQVERGEIVIKALETYYASTLLQEVELRRAWDRTGEGRSHEEIILRRLAAAIGIRQVAGAAFGRSEILDYAWMIHARRERLEGAIASVVQWMDAMRQTATADVLRSLRGSREEAA